MPAANLTGSLVAIVTPMNADGTIDWPAYEQLIEWHIAQGTEGIVAVGTTGESATLIESEHIDVIKRTVSVVNNRIAVIAGTGANATQEAVERTRAVAKLGVDAHLQVVPYYNKPSQKGLIAHFKTIAQSVDIPTLLYNVPSRTVTDMLPETVAELSTIEQIVGIKEATGSIQRAQEIKQLCGDNFIILSGDDGTAARALTEASIDGVVSVTANIVPNIIRQICDLGRSSNTRHQAMSLDDSIQLLHDALFCESNPVPVKWALHKMKRIDIGIRLPLLPAEQDSQTIITKALLSCRVI